MNVGRVAPPVSIPPERSSIESLYWAAYLLHQRRCETMSDSSSEAEIISFPNPAAKKPSSTERIWGKAVYGHGYAGIPSILIQAQRRLGINAMQMNIIIQLLDYWHEPSRKPFPTKRDLAKRMDVT